MVPPTMEYQRKVSSTTNITDFVHYIVDTIDQTIPTMAQYSYIH